MKKELLMFFKELIKTIEQVILKQAGSQKVKYSELLDEAKKPAS